MAAAKRMTKAQVIGEIATYSDLDKKSVSKVFEGLTDLIKKQLGPRGPGEFVIPGLLKLKTVKKKAIPAGQRRNPFTGQMQDFPAKPASKKVRATALKALKDLIQRFEACASTGAARARNSNTKRALLSRSGARFASCGGTPRRAPSRGARSRAALRPRGHRA